MSIRFLNVRLLGLGSPLDWRIVQVGVPKFPNRVQRPPGGLVLEHEEPNRPAHVQRFVRAVLAVS